MAEKKIVKAAGERKAAANQVKIEGNASGLRIGAWVCWVLAIVFEIMCLGFLGGKLQWFAGMEMMTKMIVTLVLDLIFVVCGSLLWKKANHINPASEANKTKFWLHNNLGVIMACLAFIPVIIYLLTNKNLDKKTKTVGTIVAVVALAIGGLFGYDFNPVSQEQLQQELGNADVDYFWVATGTKCHLYSDCQHLNASTQEEIITGSIGQAEEAGKGEICKTCKKRYDREKAAQMEEASNLIGETTEEAAEEPTEE